MTAHPMESSVSRRTAVFSIGGVTAATVALTALPRGAFATPEEVDAEIAKIYGDATPTEGPVSLDVPEIAENGNTVPVAVSVDSPMTADDYIKTVHLFADGNPAPEVIAFHFSPKSGRAEAATRMRLASTQNVVAVAETNNGTLYKAAAQVKVTIGGCGG